MEEKTKTGWRPPTNGEQKYPIANLNSAFGRIGDLERENEELRSLIQNLESRFDNLDTEVYRLKK